MKTLILILISMLYISCSKDNPVSNNESQEITDPSYTAHIPSTFEIEWGDTLKVQLGGIILYLDNLTFAKPGYNSIIISSGNDSIIIDSIRLSFKTPPMPQ